MRPFGVSTRRIEARGSTIVTVHDEFALWREHVDTMRGKGGDWVAAADAVSEVLDTRFEEHFQTDIYVFGLYKLLRPDYDQTKMPEDERAAG
eukprot:gene8658-6701_t